MTHESVVPYAPVLIRLLQGVVYADDGPTWDALLRFQTPIAEHMGKMGLTLIIDEVEGYAYLTQPEPADEDDPAHGLPRLTRRDRLGYNATLLLVLLRERLQQFDVNEPGGTRLVLSVEQMGEMMALFLPDRTDETRLRNTVRAAINRVEELGFLRRLPGIQDERYEVRRILKARLPADKLAEIQQKLKAYAGSTA